jgi:hypothetical protein
MYYAFINKDKINGVGQVRISGKDIINSEISQDVYEELITDIRKYIWNGSKVVINNNYQSLLDQEERDRLDSLIITRSDFFDGIIKAFGLNDKDILPIVQQLITTTTEDLTLQKVAINHFTNAKDFYRCHELFKLLSDRPIKVSDEVTLTITSDQWDRFFDKASKIETKENAYKELLT